ncbi:chemerin-like receptor 1 [Paramisgurnus dabryanus]|uniref:chemerin-like receptor 1 n=1 Tax=Paramisgurnus dabryanus TaxID=90735 RepID=UPI003CCF0917
MFTASYGDIMNSTLEVTDDPEYPTYDYDSVTKSPPSVSGPQCRETICVITVILKVIIFLLGIVGNGAVIWIAGFKMKKSVNTTWYLSLAISDFIFCSTLPITIVHTVTNNWSFGLFMCKFASFVMFLNMYSSIFILVIISVDRCLTVKFPVWAQNHRSVVKASVVVALTWLMSVLLSIPPLKFRETGTVKFIETGIVKKTLGCYNEYGGHHNHLTAVFLRFSLAFLIPLLSICFCYSILICKLRANQLSKSNKPYKIMTLLIVTFFLCWVPFHIVAMIEFGASKGSETFKDAIYSAQRITATLAISNSCLNPFLYAFMAKDLKKKCYSFLSKIESAIDEETRSGFKGTSITSAGDRLSTAV